MGRNRALFGVLREILVRLVAVLVGLVMMFVMRLAVAERRSPRKTALPAGFRREFPIL